MSKPDPQSHHRRILDEFTRRVEAFATVPAITNAEALNLLVRMSGAGPQDTVLDVACGAGLVVCAFAPVVRQATGIDFTPAMIKRGQALQEEKGLTNITWQVGDVVPLPYADESFSIVTCRYALHHFEDPAAVLAEITRVSAPNGKVVLADMFASPEAEEAAAFNRMEQLRDPSHVRALPLEELEELSRQAGLKILEKTFYGLDWELEALLQGSSPNPGGVELIREIFEEDLERDELAVHVRRQKSKIWFTYPIVVIWDKSQSHHVVAAWNKSSTGLGGFPPSLNRESESSPDFLLRFTWLRSGKGGESVSHCSRRL
jgi:ubiquinone/menaquinone biosynthesis C-methylase UbiE